MLLTMLAQKVFRKLGPVCSSSVFRYCLLLVLVILLLSSYLAHFWSFNHFWVDQVTVPPPRLQSQLQHRQFYNNMVGSVPLGIRLSSDDGGMNSTETMKADSESYSFITIDDIPTFHVEAANCTRLFSGNQTELQRAETYQRLNPKKKVADMTYVHAASNCEQYLLSRKYTMWPVSQEEAQFPIAFSILVFKDMEQVERLLRAVYRPQNYYCIHVDAKSTALFRRAVETLVNCLDNVFISSRSVSVQWGSFSVLEPELVCMEDLWQYTKWKYFINLTGQEFPLKTNLDLVRILKAYNGANDLEGTVKRRNKDRTKFVHNGYYATKVPKDPCPVNVTLTKGSVHVVVQRGFVDYVLHNQVALQFREWVKDTGVPDETLFSSLNHSPQLGVPGSYKGDPETHAITKPFLTRFKNWGDGPFNWPCKGRRVRMICVFGVGDLPLLESRPELFANKFYLEEAPLALDCMEELHYKRMHDEILGQRNVDIAYYEQLSFVKNHV